MFDELNRMNTTLVPTIAPVEQYSEYVIYTLWSIAIIFVIFVIVSFYCACRFDCQRWRAIKSAIRADNDIAGHDNAYRRAMVLPV